MPASALAPIISAAVSAAGAGYGIEASSNAQRKMNQDVSNVVGQLGQLQKQATPIYQQNLQNASSGDAMKQGQEQAIDEYKKIASLPSSTAPLVDAPSSKTMDARTQSAIDQQQQASSQLAQYPALQTQWNVGNTETNAQLGNIGAIGSSIASTLPAQLALAQAQGATGQAVGNVIGSLGGTIGAYGASQSANASNQLLLDKLNQVQTEGGNYSSWFQPQQ